jgi:hypothetical protein
MPSLYRIAGFTMVLPLVLAAGTAPVGSKKPHHQRLGEDPGRHGPAPALLLVSSASGHKGDRQPSSALDCGSRRASEAHQGCWRPDPAPASTGSVRWITAVDPEEGHVSILRRGPQTDLALR